MATCACAHSCTREHIQLHARPYPQVEGLEDQGAKLSGPIASTTDAYVDLTPADLGQNHEPKKLSVSGGGCRASRSLNTLHVHTHCKG